MAAGIPDGSGSASAVAAICPAERNEEREQRMAKTPSGDGASRDGLFVNWARCFRGEVAAFANAKASTLGLGCARVNRRLLDRVMTVYWNDVVTGSGPRHCGEHALQLLRTLAAPPPEMIG